MMARSGKWDFFVSYTQEDRAWAEWIAWTLEAAGYRVLIQAWDIVPGTNWVFAVDEGIRRAERTIAVASAAYLESDWGRLEILSPLRRDPLSRRRGLLVVRIEECHAEGALGMITRIDVFGLPEADARRVLLDGAEQAIRGRGKPEVQGPFPGRGRGARFPAGAAPYAGEPRAGEPYAGEPNAGEAHAGEPNAGEPNAGEPNAGERRICLAFDIEGYRQLAPGDREQVRGRVLAMLFAALARSGAPGSGCVAVDRIDGLALILPGGRTEPHATAALVSELLQGVAGIGRAVGGQPPIQSRVGVAAGAVDLASPTFEGPATATARLLASSGQVRVHAARSRRTPSAIVVADDLYREAAAGMPEGFVQIPVSASARGWILLIEGTAPAPASRRSPLRTGAPAAVAGAAVVGGAAAGGAAGVITGGLAAEAWQHLLDHEETLAHESASPAWEHATGDHATGDHGGEPEHGTNHEDGTHHEDGATGDEGAQDDSGAYGDNGLYGADDLQDAGDMQDADYGGDFGDFGDSF